MKKLAILGLIMGVLSAGCLKAQSDFGQKQHRIATPINIAQKQAMQDSFTKNEKKTTNYTLPFTENFETGIFPPTDWTTFIGSNGIGNTYNWEESGDGYNLEGAWIDWDNVGLSEDWMVTPLIDLGTNTTLSFYEKQQYSTDYGSNFYIKISTNSQTTYADFSEVLSYVETDFSTTYSLRQIDLSAYDGQSVYIAFVMTNDDGDSWYVDNIVVEEDAGGGTSGGDLLISEVAYPYDADGELARFVELYNSGSTEVDLSDYNLAFYKKNRKINLSGTIPAGETFLYAPDASDFYNSYGFYPDQSDGGIDPAWFNGTDAVLLVEGNVRRDTYGVTRSDGSGTEWDYLGMHAVRSADITVFQKNFVSSEWEISTAYYSYRDVTPGNHNQNYYWEGSTNNEWDEYSNWMVVGGVQAIPDIGANVIIPNGATRDAELGAYQFPYFFNSLTILNGATFNMTSYNILSINLDVIIESGGTLNLESDANGAAAFMPYGTVTGSTNIERYFATIGGTPTNGKWHYFSPPVSDMTSATFLDQWLMEWDEPTTYWNYITGTNEPLTAGDGYGVLLKNTYGNTISMSGQLNTGDILSPILNSTTGSGWQGWNLIGNPYSAAIDWEEVVSILPAGIDVGIHYWDSQNDQYVYYNNGNGTASQYIPPMQGFFIHCTQDNVQFTFPADARTETGVDNYYKAGEGKEYISNNKPPRNHDNRLIISATSNNGKSDKAYLEFHKKATSEFDAEFDATKFHSNNDSIAEVFLMFENREYSINVLPEELLYGRYDLHIKFGLNDTYHLSFDDIGSFNADQAIILYDKVMDTYYDLRIESNIEFNHETNFSYNRFEIVFDNYLEIAESDNKQFLIFSRNGKLNIKSINNDIFSYQLYSIEGKLLAENSNNKEVIDQHFNISSGIYLVKIMTEEHQITKKLQLHK